MSSLLRLHDELVEEKERRIDLYRRLMDREQQLAELRAYVQLLEAEASRQASVPRLPAPEAPASPRRLEAPAPVRALADEAPAEVAEAADSREPEPAPVPGGPAPTVAWIPANAGRGRGAR
ncbi:hypothetical protein [Vulgatibacter incomptus]|nr:hypothetical protein [Vulgatibacter incomptus]